MRKPLTCSLSKHFNKTKKKNIAWIEWIKNNNNNNKKSMKKKMNCIYFKLILCAKICVVSAIVCVYIILYFYFFFFSFLRHFTVLSSSSGQKPLCKIRNEQFNLYVNDNKIRAKSERNDKKYIYCISTYPYISWTTEGMAENKKKILEKQLRMDRAFFQFSIKENNKLTLFF